MKKSLLIGIILLGVSLRSSAVQTPIYPILTDNGIAGDNIYIWPQGDSVVLSSGATNPLPPEGRYSMRGQAISGVGSTWAIFYLNSDGSNRAVDLSAFAGGEIRFWAYCDTDNFNTFFQYPDGSQAVSHWAGRFSNRFNEWIPVAVPLNVPAYMSPTPLGNIVSPFGLTMNQNGTCYIDNVRYVVSPTTDAVFNAVVKDIATQTPSPAGRVTWQNGILPSGWAVANQYIELQIDDFNELSWGVQIYTNNTLANANPKYVVSGSSNPAGLVDINAPALTVPLAWSITAGTQTPVAAAPIAADPNNNPADPHSFPWLYMKDAATPAIPSQNTTAFQNGDPYVTVKNNRGIHFGQNDASNNPNFGAADPPNYIFLEANFGAALAQHNYQTSTITIEYFVL